MIYLLECKGCSVDKTEEVTLLEFPDNKTADKHIAEHTDIENKYWKRFEFIQIGEKVNLPYRVSPIYLSDGTEIPI